MKRSPKKTPATSAAGVFVFSALVALLVCAAQTRGALAHDRITTKVTWTREIAPIVNARCAGCHRPGGSSTIPLTNYEQARPWAVAIKEEVLTRRMPMWKAARGYGSFANDPSLSPFEIALVAAWVDGGAPENDRTKPATAAASAPGIVPHLFSPPSSSKLRTSTHGCGSEPISGRLLAVRPVLEAGASAGIAVRLPGGAQQIVAWIRDYDPSFAPTYWLRTPLVLPSGSQLHVESTGTCTMELTTAR